MPTARSFSRTTTQTPVVPHGVADIVGDSLTPARKAIDVEADVVVMAGVRLMAETDGHMTRP